MSILACDALTTGYARNKPVLRDISLAFDPGITVVIGPNGAGKSTLLRALLGTHPVWSGSVLLQGQPLHSVPPRQRALRMAYLAQRSTVSSNFSVREVIALGQYASQPSSRAIDDALERIGMADHAERPYHALSVGQQQRIALARVLAQLAGREDGAVLLADEPVAAMDPAHASRCFALLRTLAAQGTAVVIVLHDLTQAIRIADRAAALAPDGTLAGTGPATELLEPEQLRAIFGVAFDAAILRHGPALIPGEAVE